MFNVQVVMRGAAFEDDPRAELVRILSGLTAAVEGGYAKGRISDINGNSCGTWSLEADD